MDDRNDDACRGTWSNFVLEHMLMLHVRQRIKWEGRREKERQNFQIGKCGWRNVNAEHVRTVARKC